MDLLASLLAALSGRYEILRELGRGGMTTVHRAEDAKHARDVALKMLRPELAATLGRERFLREVQIAARLIHPHIRHCSTLDGAAKASPVFAERCGS